MVWAPEGGKQVYGEKEFVEKAGIKPGVWDWGSCGFISAESTEEDEVMGILRGEY